jgi:hypothetical protein
MGLNGMQTPVLWYVAHIAFPNSRGVNTAVFTVIPSLFCTIMPTLSRNRTDIPVQLLACASGTIANSFDSEPFNLGDENAHPSSISRDWDKRKIADDYFYLARKRLGLLRRDITACQCYLLSGIYYMYTLRPLQAWSDFVQASATFFLYQKRQLAVYALAADQPAEVDSITRRLEQRLYWTCFKSEW